jgi:hypothetical protein
VYDANDNNSQMTQYICILNVRSQYLFGGVDGYDVVVIMGFRLGSYKRHLYHVIGEAESSA